MAAKNCPYCGKDVENLASHIIRMHPKIMESLDEMGDSEPPKQPNTPPLAHSKAVPKGISEMIREKLDIMLNIKIIEMLSKSPDTSIQEIAQAMNPPQNTNLKELKEFHDIVYKENPQPIIPTGNEWVDIAQQAIPIIKEMLPAKKIEVSKNVIKPGHERARRTIEPIRIEATGSAGESGSDSTKSAAPGDTDKPADTGSKKVS